MHRDRSTASRVIKSQAALLRQLMQRGEALAGEQAQAIREQALQAMHRELQAEIARLQELADESAEEELLNLNTRQVVLEDYLQQAALLLDALRFIVRA